MGKKRPIHNKPPQRQGIPAVLAVRTGWRAYAYGEGDHVHRYFHLPEVDRDEIEKHEYPCLDCGKVFKPEGVAYYWNTPTGRLEPGCLYWNEDIPENYYWDNHKGPHLMGICPGGGHWNIDSRASNCTRRDDRMHRCWVRTGEPGNPDFNVGKGGDTCSAGAGSILIDGGKDAPEMSYHGFLHNGHFT